MPRRMRPPCKAQLSLFDWMTRVRPAPVESPPPVGQPLPDLGELFDRLNRDCFAGRIPPYPVRWNSRLRTTAGRFCCPPPSIQIGLPYHRAFPQDLEDTLKHEMVHAWLYARGRPFGHTAEFRRKLAEIGASRYARRHESLVRRPARRRFFYRCPVCGVTYAYRRRVRKYSCGRCASRYDPRYVLRLIAVEDGPVCRLVPT